MPPRNCARAARPKTLISSGRGTGRDVAHKARVAEESVRRELREATKAEDAVPRGNLRSPRGGPRTPST